ncbi:MAG: chorismate synthase [Crocinitomicaceae bacterium]|nr:chorismate synthase [Crocinitomicaceae bacterium]|tara:strand:+ start:200 stop:1273 length:1074 start_codon:yes stop_codon:yes gene_type:complete
MGNTFGNLFKLTSFGESHGSMIGGIIEGCPAGLEINKGLIQKDLDRRKPGQSKVTSPRKEDDKVQLLSGIFEGKSTGTPIGFLIPNINSKSQDYSNIKDVFRPSHADYTYEEKYGLRDYRGGGRSSARETACRVVAGSIAKQLLNNYGIKISAYVSSIGNIFADEKNVDLNKDYDSNIVRCPDNDASEKMINLITELKSKGNTVGGQIKCIINGVKPGLGEPVFDKLHADLGKAMLSINAVKGFEYGSGFSGSKMTGSVHNDEFIVENGNVSTKTNNSGGIQGGISNGEEIYFKVAFKPVATIMSKQNSIDKEKNNVELSVKGRHDPCVVPRAVPIVESMAAIVLADHLLRNRTSKL